MEQAIFVRFFGNSPKIRVLNYLLKSRGLDCSKQDMIRNCNVSGAVLNQLWKEFVGLKIVIPTREIGKAKLFQAK